MSDIYKYIEKLVNYGVSKGLIQIEDKIYARNKILDILHIEEYSEVYVKKEKFENPQIILEYLLDYAWDKGILENNSTLYRDLLDTKIMDCLTPSPGKIISQFNKRYSISPEKATSEFYQTSLDSNYIRKSRIEKNLFWKYKSKYGKLELTVNLSKPEKDPKDIAKAQNKTPSSYPKCVLCRENEGYAGRINHPARQNLRLIPLNLEGEKWYLQYSPYSYYPEHCIILCEEHRPMKIDIKTFRRLLSFVEQFPHYFIGSNADLPLVGGSILSHDHFQGGRYTFPMEKAREYIEINLENYPNIEGYILDWPMSVLRLKGKNQEDLSKLSSQILENWRKYSNPKLNILSSTKGENHNTITPIARYKNDQYEIDLVFRNNRKSEEYPYGIFHPHEKYHHIKKENIGLIEVMGRGILPSRLKKEIYLLEKCLEGKIKIKDYEELSSYKNWYEMIKEKYPKDQNWKHVLEKEIGTAYQGILEDCGVFKNPKDLAFAVTNDLLN
ncbi:MAG: UDP-glucose--hexose-1-phosphate uridylyltransferase [Eubacteriales bacterium]